MNMFLFGFAVGVAAGGLVTLAMLMWHLAAIDNQNILPAPRPLYISDEAIDALYKEQYEEYGQLCDRLDIQMFARAVLAYAEANS